MERGKQPSAGHGSDKSTVAHTKDFEVKQFLDRYAQDLVDLDASAVAERWAVPAFVVGDELVVAVSSAQETENFFKAAKDNYIARGIVRTRPEIMKLDWVADHIALVKTRWINYDAKGNEVDDEVCTYTLRYSDDGEFHILVAILHGIKACH